MGQAWEEVLKASPNPGSDRWLWVRGISRFHCKYSPAHHKKIPSAHSCPKYSLVENVNEQFWPKLFAFEPNSVVILCSETKRVAGYKTLHTTHGEVVPLCFQNANHTYNPNIQHSLSTKETEYLLWIRVFFPQLIPLTINSFMRSLIWKVIKWSITVPTQMWFKIRWKVLGCEKLPKILATHSWYGHIWNIHDIFFFLHGLSLTH